MFSEHRWSQLTQLENSHMSNCKLYLTCLARQTKNVIRPSRDLIWQLKTQDLEPEFLGVDPDSAIITCLPWTGYLSYHWLSLLCKLQLLTVLTSQASVWIKCVNTYKTPKGMNSVILAAIIIIIIIISLITVLLTLYNKLQYREGRAFALGP